MVDGQMRTLCALAALLHSSARRKSHNDNDAEHASSLVLVHDYYDKKLSLRCPDCHNYKWQLSYHVLETVADMVDHSGAEIAVFQKKPNVSDEQILELYGKIKQDWINGKQT